MNKEQLQGMLDAIQRAYEELPKAIEQAYREGHKDSKFGMSFDDEDDDWNQSNSKKALDAGIDE